MSVHLYIGEGLLGRRPRPPARQQQELVFLRQRQEDLWTRCQQEKLIPLDIEVDPDLLIRL